MSSFDGVAEVYETARHSYPTELRDHLVDIGALKPSSVVVDLGAGTGQLSLLLADIAGDVTAIDPEPDMVRVGKLVTRDVPAIQWLPGFDRDVAELLESPIDLVVIGNAFHHMDQPTLLADLDSLVALDGHVVVCSTSIPVWLQQTDWSVALRSQLSSELGRAVGGGGTPDHVSDRTVLGESPFNVVDTWSFERKLERSGESIVGEVVSSASGAIDEDAAARLHSALLPFLTEGALTETVKTTAVIAKR